MFVFFIYLQSSDLDLYKYNGIIISINLYMV